MTSYPLDAEDHLIGDIYDAALNPGLWPQVLQQLVELTACNSAIITALDSLNPDYTVAFSHNIPAEPLQVYREAGLDIIDMELHVPPMLQAGLGSVVSSTTMHGSQDDYIRRAGEFYQRCLKPSRIHYLAGTLLDHGDFRSATLGVHRPPEASPMAPEEIACLARLAPHFRRALQIHRQLTAVQRHNAMLYRMLDALVAGVILLDARGRVRYANPSAEALLRQHGSLRVTARAELQASEPASNAALQRALRATIGTGLRQPAPVRSAQSVIGLSRPDGSQLLMLTVTPLSELSGYADLASDDIAAAVFMTDPSARLTLSRRLLRESFRLGERECDICEAFVNHATLEGTAQACGLSLASVRTYLREIYEKTGQHSQAELMRLLTGLRLDFEHIR
jgi:PAS domain-containing protein/DNA-binding CsgD family transcriptional regulator